MGLCNAQTLPMAQELLSSAEVCASAFIDRSTLSRWVKEGLISPEFRMPGKTGALLFTPEQAERIAELARDRKRSAAA